MLCLLVFTGQFVFFGVLIRGNMTDLKNHSQRKRKLHQFDNILDRRPADCRVASLCAASSSYFLFTGGWQINIEVHH